MGHNTTPVGPGTIDEAALFLTEANRRSTPVRIGDELRLDRLARILQHEAGDLTCSVEAGVRLSTLQAALLPHRQRLALDPPGDPTIGACLAANLSGPLRHRYGAPRDLVLGVTAVLGDGSIGSSGGTVVKNVAGYDLGRLLCGSDGRLALICRVALRLHPLPEATRSLVVTTDDPVGCIRELEGARVVVSALDVLHPGRVAVLFEGSRATVDAQFERARARVGGSSDDAIWAESRTLQTRLPAVAPFTPSRLAETLETHDEALVRPSVGVAYVAHAPTRPTQPALEQLHAALKRALDPNGILQ